MRIIIFCLIFFSFFIFAPEVLADNIYFDPAYLVVSQNKNFSLPLYITGASSTFGIGFDLIYDHNLFEYASSTEGAFFNQGCLTILMATTTATTTPAGERRKLVFGLTRLGAFCGGLNGGGLVATLNFRSRNQEGEGSFIFANNGTCELINGTCNFITGNWQGAAVAIDNGPPLIISGPLASNISENSADIYFLTNENSLAQIEYGLNDAYGATTTLTQATTSHIISLNNLTASTTYHYRIRLRDIINNESVSVNYIFSTLPDTTAPIISNISAQFITSSGATISWSVNEPAILFVEYGLNQNYGSQTGTTTGNSLVLNGLTAGTTYHYRIVARDLAGNMSMSADFSFNTLTSGGSGGGGGGGSGGGGGGTTPAPPPSPNTQIYDQQPTGYKLEASSTYAILTWQNPQGANFKEAIIIKSTELITVYMDFAVIQGIGEKIYQGKGNTFIDYNLAPNLNYYYALFLVDIFGRYTKPQIIYKAAIKTESETRKTTTTEKKEIYENLAGASREIVDQVSYEEAVQIYEHNQYVNLNETTRRLYLFIINKSPHALSEKDKFAIAFYVHYGTPTTKNLGAGERTGVLNSYLSVFSKLPRQEEEWQDVIKIANGRWPEQRNEKAEKKAQDTYFFIVYRRPPNMANANDNAAVTVITYGLRPRLRNLNSEKEAIKIFKAIFNKNPVNAIDWDIVRAIAYSGAKR